jgi:hypothetical protein
MNMQEAIRKPFPVKVVQVTLQNIQEVAEWCKGTIEYRPTRMLGTTTDLPIILIEGVGANRGKKFEASLSCWVVELNGSFRSFKPMQFEAAFDLLPTKEQATLQEAEELLATKGVNSAREHLGLDDLPSENGTPDPEASIYSV